MATGTRPKRRVLPNVVQASSANPFAPLLTLGDSEMDTTHAAPKPTGSLKPEFAPPPITVASSNVLDIHKKVMAAGVMRYTTAATFKGIVVRTTTTADFKAVCKHLKSTNTEFHSYQLHEDKTTKIVLNGLIDMPIEDLKEILQQEKINPIAIKKLLIKKKRFDQQAMYLLHFAKGTVDIKILQSIKSLNHQMVVWRYFSGHPGPMQCKNCQRFGHGAENCFRAPQCIKCSQGHKSSTCPLSAAAGEEKIPTHKLKCANCEGNHTANFSGCPKRQSQLQSVKVQKSKKQNEPIYSTQQAQVQFSNSDFPPLPSRSQNSHTSSSRANNHTSYADATNSNELFNSEELIQIISDTFHSLRGCKSKEDQIKVVFTIVQKYCYR